IDVYDAVRNDFVARRASANAKVAIEPDSAAVIVLVPADAKITYDGRRTLADGVVIDYDNGRVARRAPKSVAARRDLSRAVPADRGTITVDGDASDWAKLTSETVHLDTGGRGAMTVDVRFAWDDDFLYVLVQQKSAAKRVHEVENLDRYSAAVWDF